MIPEYTATKSIEKNWFDDEALALAHPVEYIAHPGVSDVPITPRSKTFSRTKTRNITSITSHQKNVFSIFVNIKDYYSLFEGTSLMLPRGSFRASNDTMPRLSNAWKDLNPKEKRMSFMRSNSFITPLPPTPEQIEIIEKQIVLWYQIV